MFGLLKTLLFSLALQQGAGNAKRRLQRAALRAAMACLGGLLLLGGLVFLIAAGHAALVLATDARTANLICGAGLTLIGGVVVAASRNVRAGKLIDQSNAPAPEPQAQESQAQESLAMAVLGRDVERILSRHVGTVATGAFVAGLLMATRRR
jgi:hypothetical protein